MLALLFIATVFAACPSDDCGCSWANQGTCVTNPGPQDICWQTCCCPVLGEETYWSTVDGGDNGDSGNDGGNSGENDPDGWEGVAKTTRYWDCCKPSCSWNGKADIAAGFGPVRACLQDGSPADSNARSGCGGGGDPNVAGPSFACTDNQPWVEDGVLFAFAAGGAGDGDCCSCYELEFLDYSIGASSYQGQLHGERMVVQVTNTGGDLSSSHFDIQIPGGGFGIFNACVGDENPVPQFTGSPSEWGARYGGVAGKAQCGALPAVLQPGCEWRFDHFLNSDNPAVKYRKVRCPESLVAKSGCRLANEVDREVEGGAEPAPTANPTPPPSANEEPCEGFALGKIKRKGNRVPLESKKYSTCVECRDACADSSGTAVMYKESTGACKCYDGKRAKFHAKGRGWLVAMVA